MNKEQNRDDLSTAAVGVRGPSSVDSGVHRGCGCDAGDCQPDARPIGVRVVLPDHTGNVKCEVITAGAAAEGDVRADLQGQEPGLPRWHDPILFAVTAGVLILITLAIAAVSGCEKQAPSQGPAAVAPPPAVAPSDLPPPGYEVEHVERRTYEGGTFSHTQEGSGTGAGLNTAAADVASKFNASAPTSSLTGASGGSTSIEQTLTSQSGKTVLVVAGILFLAGAGAGVYFNRYSIAGASAGVGLACLLIAFYPAVLLWALAAAVLVLGVCLLTNDTTRHRLREALRATVAGVEHLPDGQRHTVKLAVAAHADQKDEAVIGKIKAADKLLTESARRRARAGT